MSENIIVQLISQHRNLQTKVLELQKMYQGTNRPNPKLVLAGLEKFRNDLLDHLELENNSFYTKLLEGMKQDGQDTTDTEAFIDQMKIIGVTVVSFLDKYNTESTISSNTEEFSQELADISSTLNMRIESEEEGVYLYGETYVS